MASENSRHRRWLIPALLGLAICLVGCERSPRSTGSLPHDIYAWQRIWIPAVRTALREAQPSVNSVVVLTAELASFEGTPKTTRVTLDYEALVALKKPIGLAIRIGPYSGPFRADDQVAQTILQLVQERIAEAKKNGITPAELQIDFDCADSKLNGYRVWLATIRKAVAPLPVRPTVLPSWLAQKEFRRLARDCGGFILQVHSVAPPKKPADTERLTNPKLAQKWVEQAGKLRIPFRVALPTYTYLVAFDNKNQMVGISAEAPSSRWPKDTRIVRWEANPSEIAALIAQWSKDRPASMTGIIWYRLPVVTDTLNWRWTTLSEVMRGEEPRSELRMEATNTQPADLVLINAGERDEALPDAIEARWEDAKLVTADAVGGYSLESPSDGASPSVRFRRSVNAALSRLPPGARRNIGWIRCDTPTHIRVSVGETAVPSPPLNSSVESDSDSGDGLR